MSTGVTAGTGERATGPPPVRPRAGRPARAHSLAARQSRRRRAIVGWSFALPFTVLFMVFMALPIIASLVMSFTDMRSSDLRNPFAINPVGLENYTRLFEDELFRRAAVNTAIFVLFGVPLTLACGLAAAVFLNAGVVKFRTLFRVGYYLPVVTSIVAIAVVWRFLLQVDAGLVNTLLKSVGVTGPNWLEDTRFALPSIIVMATWKNLGFLMVIFLAGLQAVPHHLYEAALIDGAGRWRQFTSITLPLLRPTLLFAAVVTGIGYLQLFEEPFVMTQGGPLSSTLSVAYHTYNQFGYGNYGYAAAMSYALFIAIVVLSLVQFRLIRPKD
jgi:multiple sugar transport system permease protein